MKQPTAAAKSWRPPTPPPPLDEATTTGAPSKAMHRTALLPTAQTQLLATLPGQELDELTTDGWSVFIVVGGQLIHFFPKEVHYDQDDPIRDVDRIDVAIASEQAPTITPIGRDLGSIERVCLVRTLTAYLPPEDLPAHDITVDGRTVKVPAGQGHRTVSVAPSRLNALLAGATDVPKFHFMPVDIGVVIVTAHHRVLVNTCGYFVEASVDADDHSGQIRDSDLIELHNNGLV